MIWGTEEKQSASVYPCLLVLKERRLDSFLKWSSVENLLVSLWAVLCYSCFGHWGESILGKPPACQLPGICLHEPCSASVGSGSEYRASTQLASSWAPAFCDLIRKASVGTCLLGNDHRNALPRGHGSTYALGSFTRTYGLWGWEHRTPQELCICHWRAPWPEGEVLGMCAVGVTTSRQTPGPSHMHNLACARL